MMARLDRYAPPGMNQWQFKLNFWVALIFAALCSMTFLLDFTVCLRDLEKQYVDFVMPTFDSLVDPALKGFDIMPVTMVPFVLMNYAYFYQDSKSIYTMRRLESPWELHKRCWTLPVLGAVCLILAGWLVYWLYCGIYFLLTPDAHIPNQQILFIWRLLP